MDQRTRDDRFRVILTLWASLLGGVTIFTGVVVALTSGAVGSWSPSLAPGLAAKLMVLPVLSMAAGIVFRRGEVKRTGDADARVGAYQVQVIIGAALQEGGGLFGLALCLMSGQATWALGVWAATAVAMGITRPSRDELDALLR